MSSDAIIPSLGTTSRVDLAAVDARQKREATPDALRDHRSTGVVPSVQLGVFPFRARRPNPPAVSRRKSPRRGSRRSRGAARSRG